MPTANEPVEISVLVFKKSTSNAHLTNFALTAMRKLVSIRHPSVVRVLDSAENETGIFIATEKIVPITILPRFKDAPIHGIYQIVKGLQFIHEEVKVVHGSLDPSNIYVASSGGFRIGGFELSRPKLDSGYPYDKQNIGQGVFKRIDCRELTEVDFCGFVLCVHFLVNGSGYPSGVLEGQTSLTAVVDAVSRASNSNDVKKLLNEILKTRKITTSMSVFQSNETVAVLEFLDSIHVKGDEAVTFLESLQGRLNRLPKEFQQGIMMETLLGPVLSISSLVPYAVPVICTIAASMDKEIFRKTVQPKLITLFAVQDRSIRFRLLSGLPQVVKLLDQKTLESHILVESLSGFTDSHPSIREQTLRGVVEMSTHISSNAVEKRVIPNLVRMLKDPESSIRTNAIVAIAKAGTKLDDESKINDALAVAITAGLKDSFGPAKLVGLETLGSLKMKNLIHAASTATRFLPLLCPLMVDQDSLVAHLALKVMESTVREVKKLTPAPPEKLKQSTAPAMTAPEIYFPTFSSAPAASSGMSLQNSTAASPFDFAAPAWAPSPQPVAAPNYSFNRPVAGAPKMKDTDFDSFWDDVAPARNNKQFNDNSLI